MTFVALPRVHGRSRIRVNRPQEKRSASRSATRALDVLEVFGERRCPLRAIEIRAHLALAPSTADQLLKTMVDSGHLVFQAATKTYRPSPRLAGFGGWLIDVYGADAGLRRLVRGLQRATGLVVTLTTPNDLAMQVVDHAGPLSGETRGDARGLRISLFGSIIGSAHLSTLGDGEMARLAARARIGEAELATMRAVLRQIRADGYADGPSDMSDIWSIAMPLDGPERFVPLVLGVAGPAGRVEPQRAGLYGTMAAAVAEWRAKAPAATG